MVIYVPTSYEAAMAHINGGIARAIASPTGRAVERVSLRRPNKLWRSWAIGEGGAKREVLCKLAGYLKNDTGRMDDPRYRL